MAAIPKETPQETLDKISLACLDAINQAKTKDDYKRWVENIWLMGNPYDDDDLDDEGDE